MNDILITGTPFYQNMNRVRGANRASVNWSRNNDRISILNCRKVVNKQPPFFFISAGIGISWQGTNHAENPDTDNKGWEHRLPCLG
jgi:hypothetical protein